MMLSLKFLIFIITSDSNFSGLYNADYLTHANSLAQYKDDYTYTQLKEFYSPQKTLAFNTVINYY